LIKSEFKLKRKPAFNVKLSQKYTENQIKITSNINGNCSMGKRYGKTEFNGEWYVCLCIYFVFRIGLPGTISEGDIPATNRNELWSTVEKESAEYINGLTEK
jgi:hypothetical protein